MSWFSDLMHPGRPYEQAGNTATQFYNEAQGHVQPYNKLGQESGMDLQSILHKLMNPQQLQNEWTSGYEESPYAKQTMEKSKTQGLDAASSMGLLGSSAALNNIQTGANNIMEKDRANYLKNLMDMYTQAAGIGQNMFGTGAASANQMGQNAMNQGNTMAGLQFGQQQAGPNMLANIGKGGLQMLMQYLTGGMGTGGYGRGSLTPEVGYSGGGY